MDGLCFKTTTSSFNHFLTESFINSWRSKTDRLSAAVAQGLWGVCVCVCVCVCGVWHWHLVTRRVRRGLHVFAADQTSHFHMKDPWTHTHTHTHSHTHTCGLWTLFMEHQQQSLSIPGASTSPSSNSACHTLPPETKPQRYTDSQAAPHTHPFWSKERCSPPIMTGRVHPKRKITPWFTHPHDILLSDKYNQSNINKKKVLALPSFIVAVNSIKVHLSIIKVHKSASMHHKSA